MVFSTLAAWIFSHVLFAVATLAAGGVYAGLTPIELISGSDGSAAATRDSFSFSNAPSDMSMTTAANTVEDADSSALTMVSLDAPSGVSDQDLPVSMAANS